MKQVNTKHHCLEILFYSLRINCCFKALEVFCIQCTALLVVFIRLLLHFETKSNIPHNC